MAGAGRVAEGASSSRGTRCAAPRLPGPGSPCSLWPAACGLRPAACGLELAGLGQQAAGELEASGLRTLSQRGSLVRTGAHCTAWLRPSHSRREHGRPDIIYTCTTLTPLFPSPLPEWVTDGAAERKPVDPPRPATPRCRHATPTADSDSLNNDPRFGPKDPLHDPHGQHGPLGDDGCACRCAAMTMMLS